MLLGAIIGLAGRLSHLLPHLLTFWHYDISVVVPEEETILEELLNVGPGGLDLLSLLLHVLELCHLSRDLDLSLLLLELLLLDLGPGLSPCGRGLHKVAGLALGH